MTLRCFLNFEVQKSPVSQLVTIQRQLNLRETEFKINHVSKRN